MAFLHPFWDNIVKYADILPISSPIGYSTAFLVLKTCFHDPITPFNSIFGYFFIPDYALSAPFLGQYCQIWWYFANIQPNRLNIWKRFFCMGLKFLLYPLTFLWGTFWARIQTPTASESDFSLVLPLYNHFAKKIQTNWLNIWK